MSTPQQLYNEWLVYHRANPRVYELICGYAAMAIKAGHRQYAIATIWERIRWEYTVITSDIHFKMPNNHRAYYSRLWLKDHPQYVGFFRTAELRSERKFSHYDRYGRLIGSAI
jgi:hypothetical protein